MPIRILLVEDDVPLSALIADYLRTHQYEVDRLFDGTDAVATIVARHPDLVLLDINLPGKDGFEICRDARTQYDGIVIMMTARDEQFDELLGLEFGADDFLHKPIEPRILLARIKAHLRRVRMRPDDVEPASPHRSSSASFRSTGPIARCVFPTAAHPPDVDRVRPAVGARLSRRRGGQPKRPDAAAARIEFDGFDRSIDGRISSCAASCVTT